MDPVGLTNAWLQAVHRIQSGNDDPLRKPSHGERTMTEIIERALRHGMEPAEPSTSGRHVDRLA